MWNDTSIRGQVKRGTRNINSELYIGRLVWNCQRYVKDPSTGRRVSWLNPESKWIVTDVPELRILDDALWQAAKTRQNEIADKYANVTEAVREHHAKNRLNSARLPRSLLSGLIFCGYCSGPISLRGRIASFALRMSRTVHAQMVAPFRAMKSNGAGWIARQGNEKAAKTKTPAAGLRECRYRVVAGIGFEPMTFRL